MKIILEIITGSHLYGTNTPTSDKDGDLLLDIRNGKYTAQHVLELKDELKKKIQDLELKTQLPKEPKLEEINRFVKLEMIKWENEYFNINFGG